MTNFQGTYTALITPFTASKEVDYIGLEKLIDQQITANVEGVLLLGTTGESPSISSEERTQIIKLGVKKACGKTQIIVGTGTNDTAKSIELALEAKDLGADAILVVNPYYNKPTQQGLYEHFWSIAEAIDIPQIVYNIQGRTGVNLATETLVRLSQHKNIVGVKEASGDISQMMDVIASTPSDFVVLSGDDNLTYPLIMLGGHGVISVLANLLPVKIKELTDAALQCAGAECSDAKSCVTTTRQLHYQLMPLMKGCFMETNPLPIKTAVAATGVITEEFRLPMCPMQDASKQAWLRMLQESNVL